MRKVAAIAAVLVVGAAGAFVAAGVAGKRWMDARAAAQLAEARKYIEADEAVNKVSIQLRKALQQSADVAALYELTSPELQASCPEAEFERRFAAFLAAHGRRTSYTGSQSSTRRPLDPERPRVAPGEAVEMDVGFERGGAGPIELDFERRGADFVLTRIAIRTPTDPLELGPVSVSGVR